MTSINYQPTFDFFEEGGDRSMTRDFSSSDGKFYMPDLPEGAHIHTIKFIFANSGAGELSDLLGITIPEGDGFRLVTEDSEGGEIHDLFSGAEMRTSADFLSTSTGDSASSGQGQGSLFFSRFTIDLGRWKVQEGRRPVIIHRSNLATMNIAFAGAWYSNPNPSPIT